MSTRIALIPAYEPDQTLTKVVMELKKKKFEIVVVDDGSSPDKTAIFQEIAENTNVIHHSKNSGKGTAIKTGLQFIKDKYKDSYTVVTVDADGQHKLVDIVRVADIMNSNFNSIVVGCRKFNTGKIPLRSLIGNIIFLPSNREKTYMLICGLTAVINVVTNFIFIPVYSTIAAASTTAFCNLIMFILFF